MLVYQTQVKMFYVFYFVKLVVCCSALVTHCIGLLAIHYSNKRSNQNLIICSLSVSECIATVVWIFSMVYREAIVGGNVHGSLMTSAILYLGEYSFICIRAPPPQGVTQSRNHADFFHFHAFTH